MLALRKINCGVDFFLNWVGKKSNWGTLQVILEEVGGLTRQKHKVLKINFTNVARQTDFSPVRQTSRPGGRVQVKYFVIWGGEL